MPVLAECRHNAIAAELPAPNHSRDERLAMPGIILRKRPGIPAGGLVRNGRQGIRPRFVIPKDARYPGISEMAQNDNTPVIRIPGHLIAPYGVIRMEHSDFDAVVRRAGCRIPD